MQIDKTIFGGVMFSLAVAYGWGALNIPAPFGGSEHISPSTFPFILSIVLGACSLFYLFKPTVSSSWPTGKSLLEILAVITTLFAYTVLIQPLGFILATTLCVSFMSWRLRASVKNAVVIAFSGAALIFTVFNFGLDLPLPIGFGV